MTTDQARLLIRVAGKLSGDENDSDRLALLQWADSLLVQGVRGPDRPTSETRPSVTLRLPLRIYKVFKKVRYEAELLPGWRVRFRGETYPSPSAAATAVTQTNQSGWRFWRYTEPVTDVEYPIDRLRATTGVRLAAMFAANEEFVRQANEGIAALNRGEKYRLRDA